MYVCPCAAPVKCVTSLSSAEGSTVAVAAHAIRNSAPTHVGQRGCHNRLRSWTVPVQYLSGSCVQRQRRQRGKQICMSAAFEPFPYKSDDYVEVRLTTVRYNEVDSHVPSATIVLNRVENGDTHMDHGLALMVGGDFVHAISNQMLRASDRSPRPAALDLLWKVLQRGKEISKRQWLLQRVAIVAMKDSTYIGRLFFGNEETGEAVWDLDCRPSDGILLSVKANCPVFVHKKVWVENKVPAGYLSGGYELIGSKQEVESLQDMTGTKAFTTIRSQDPEPVKRLKREMAVALSEEDYASAARIRDHPFMKLSVQIVMEMIAGRQSEADSLQTKLEEAVRLSSPSEE